MKFHTISATNK